MASAMRKRSEGRDDDVADWEGRFFAAEKEMELTSSDDGDCDDDGSVRFCF
jgi:hypothetical protein